MKRGSRRFKLRHRFFSFPFPVQWTGIQIVFLVAVAAACPVRAQPAEPGKQDTTILDEVWPQLTDFSRIADSGTKTYINQETGDISRYILGNVRRELKVGPNRLRLVCDRLYIRALGLLKDDDEKGADDLEFYFYADGNVRLELPEQGSTIEASSVYYDHREGLGVIRQAKIRSSTSGLRGILNSMEMRDLRGTSTAAHSHDEKQAEVLLNIEVLRTRNFVSFNGEGITLSNCDYSTPHVALAADFADIRPAASAASRGAVGTVDQGHYEVDLSGARLEILGTTILPLPLSHWDTRWQDYLPLRSIDLGSSSKFGFFSSVEWNMNFLLDQLPLGGVPGLRHLVENTRLGFETTQMAKRGLGWGPIVEYGSRADSWEPWQLSQEESRHYGEGRLFSIHDHGTDRSAGGFAPPEPGRYWGSFLHRHAVSGLGTIDIEYSAQSDRNFLNEYFETVAKQEKEQESLVSLRRNLGDNLHLGALYKYRVNDFDETIERLPELKLSLYQQPVFDSGLYMDLQAAAANLRRRSADGTSDTPRHGRLDLYNGWSYPLDWLSPYLEVRPWTFARYTGYEKVLDPSRDFTDRTAFGSGVTVSQQWSRTFPATGGGALSELFGVDSFKHLVVPEVSYLNVFSSDLSPGETFGIDEVDSFDVTQRVSLSLRQALVSRFNREDGGQMERPLLGRRNVALKQSSFRRHHLLDSEISLVFYPQGERDNGGEDLSLLFLDHTLRASESLSLRSWIALDPNDGFSDERMDNSIRAEVVPGLFSATLGNVNAKAVGVGEDSNFVYGLLSLYPQEKWRAQFYYARNIQSEKDSEVSFTLGRVFHRYALFFEYSFDAGEDDNQTFSINFRPVGFAGSGMESWSRW